MKEISVKKDTLVARFLHKFEWSEARVCEYMNAMEQRLVAEILTQDIDELEFEEYLTWLDHFKATYFPNWLKRYFPVQYRHHKWTAKRLFDPKEIGYVDENWHTINMIRKQNHRVSDGGE